MDTGELRYGDFAYLRVKEVTDYGAFLETGGPKDLLLPFSEQSKKVEQGKSYIVAVILDEETERPMATQKYKRFLSDETSVLTKNKEVDLLVTHFTELGANVIIDSEFEGLIYANEIFTRLKIGDRVKGFIKQVRDNGKVDVALQKQGVEAITDDTEKVLQHLKENEGFAPLNDNTEPFIIYRDLGISKKAFKKAIGTLYKQKVIAILETGIRLIETKKD